MFYKRIAQVQGMPGYLGVDRINKLFKASRISVRESFVIRVDGAGVVEQVDGVIEMDGHLYLVEIK